MQTLSETYEFWTFLGMIWPNFSLSKVLRIIQIIQIIRSELFVYSIRSNIAYGAFSRSWVWWKKFYWIFLMKMVNYPQTYPRTPKIPLGWSIKAEFWRILIFTCNLVKYVASKICPWRPHFLEFCLLSYHSGKLSTARFYWYQGKGSKLNS